MNSSRIRTAFKAFSIHFGTSLAVAALIAALVFLVWYPYPFRELAGGKDLFILVIAVDIICGPLLTAILFSPHKPKKELLTDLSLVVLIQLAALAYGVWNVWLARPIYLVNESNRFHVVSRVGIDTDGLQKLPAEMQPRLFSGPLKVTMRDVLPQEQASIDMTLKLGNHTGKAQLPELYLPYDGAKAFQNSSSISTILKLMPQKRSEMEAIAKEAGVDLQNLHFTYVLAQEAWFGVLNDKGEIIGFANSK
ncbi:MAG TPA: pilus assembly protein [Burkholderiaceae bacterium]|nr:pilus assembly protein [Burkholderiaceae bacterium]